MEEMKSFEIEAARRGIFDDQTQTLTRWEII